jgi:hypothetical protein
MFIVLNNFQTDSVIYISKQVLLNSVIYKNDLHITTIIEPVGHGSTFEVTESISQILEKLSEV